MSEDFDPKQASEGKIPSAKLMQFNGIECEILTCEGIGLRGVAEYSKNLDRVIMRDATIFQGAEHTGTPMGPVPVPRQVISLIRAN